MSESYICPECGFIVAKGEVNCLRCSANPKAKHFDEGKVSLQNILFFKGLDDVAKVGDYGAKKYGQWNLLGGSEWMRYLGSCARHLTAVVRGQWLDAESKLPHLAHLIYNALIIMEWYIMKVGTDDRPCLKQ